VQLQTERCQPRSEFAEKPVRIRVPLKANDGIVGVADHDHRPGCRSLEPLIRLQVVDGVQVDVRQQW
jgi:hypothetical protein